VATFLLQYIPTGAMNETYRNSALFTSCRKNWWWYMLYASSERRDGLACMGWFWYLSTDFQLFIYGGVVCAFCFVQRGLWLAVVLLTVLIPTALATWKEPFFAPDNDYFHPWLRAPPYGYGLLAAGIVGWERPRHFVRSRWTRIALLGAAGAMGIACINVMWVARKSGNLAEMDRYTRFVSFFVAIFWGLSHLVLTVVWANHPGGLIKHFFAHPFFAVVSKLTFCAYIVHPLVIVLHGADLSMQQTFSKSLLYFQFGGVAFWTFFGAFVLHVTVEVPFAHINDFMTKRLM